MKNQSKNITIFSFWLGLYAVLAACNQREIKNIHIYSQPQLGLKYEERDTYYKEYPVYLTLQLDKDNGIDTDYQITFKNTFGKGKVLAFNDGNAPTTISKGEPLKLQYIPKAIGAHKLECVLTDSQGKESIAELEIKGVQEKTIAYPDIKRFSIVGVDPKQEAPYPNNAFFLIDTLNMSRESFSGVSGRKNTELKYTFFLEESFVAEDAVKYTLTVENKSPDENINGKIWLYYSYENYYKPIFTIPLYINHIRKDGGFFTLVFNYEMEGCGHWDCNVSPMLGKDFNYTIPFKFTISNGKKNADVLQPISVARTISPHRWLWLEYKLNSPESQGIYVSNNRYIGRVRISQNSYLGWPEDQTPELQMSFKPLNYKDKAKIVLIDNNQEIKAEEPYIFRLNSSKYLRPYSIMFYYDVGCKPSQCPEMPKLALTLFYSYGMAITDTIMLPRGTSPL